MEAHSRHQAQGLRAAARVTAGLLQGSGTRALMVKGRCPVHSDVLLVASLGLPSPFSCLPGAPLCH